MNTSPPAPHPSFNLMNLHEMPLNDYYHSIQESVERLCGGPAACRQRLKAEAKDLLGLAQLSGRLQIQWLDLSAGLRAKVTLEVPVPCLPDPNGPLQVAPCAVLGLVYPQNALLRPQPGYAFVRVLQPQSVWLSVVSPDHNQILCLGPRLPAGILLKEILLMTYGALSLQTILLDQLDPAGVLNPVAADWWQRNPQRIPLTREPFLRAEVNYGK